METIIEDNPHAGGWKDKWDSEEGQTHVVETDKCYCSDFNPKCEHCKEIPKEAQAGDKLTK